MTGAIPCIAPGSQPTRRSLGAPPERRNAREGPRQALMHRARRSPALGRAAAHVRSGRDKRRQISRIACPGAASATLKSAARPRDAAPASDACPAAVVSASHRRVRNRKQFDRSESQAEYLRLLRSFMNRYSRLFGYYTPVELRLIMRESLVYNIQTRG